MKHSKPAFLIALMTCGFVVHTQAYTVVQDTWLDGERHYPAAPTYSEFYVDSDSDTDIESAWFAGGSGTFDALPTGGHLVLTQTLSSASLTTYFTPEGAELNLNNAGDWLKVTWVFNVSGQMLANTSQGLRIALVDSPAASRVTSENSPGSDTYSGYALFLNMDTSLTHSSPFQLFERAAPATASALLSSSSSWTSLAADGTLGNDGYDPGNDYTFTLQLTRNGAGGLDILTSMAGGTVDNDGLMSITFTDTTPNGGSFAFDTFQFRPDGYDRAYEIIDTTLFKVEASVIPEPSTLALLGLGALGLLVQYRRSRK